MSSWPTKKLGDVVMLQGGFAFKSSEYFTSGTPLVRIQNLQNELIDLSKAVFIEESKQKNFEKFLLKADDILIAMSGATTGKMARISKDQLPAFLNQRVGRFVITKNKKLDKGFLWLFLESLQDSILKSAYGGAQPNVSPSKIESIEIPLPPLPTQKKIVAKVEKLLAKIKEAKRLRAEAQASAQNLLPAALHKIFSEGKKKGWKEKMLGKICKNTSNIKWSEHKNEGYQYIDLASVSRDSFSITETKQVNFKNAPSRAKKIIITNDVIFGTTRPTLMRVTVIPPEYDNSICSTGFVVLRAQKKYILPQFIYYFIRSERFMDRMEKIQTGASYPAVSDAKVLETKIPLPPLGEQKKIVAYLDSLSTKSQQIQTLQAQTAGDLAALEQAVLRKAFSG